MSINRSLSSVPASASTSGLGASASSPTMGSIQTSSREIGASEVRRGLSRSIGGTVGSRPQGNIPVAVARRGILSLKSKNRAATRKGYYGHPDCPVGTMFASRKDCSNAGVHFPPIAGISCSTSSARKDISPGAFSIVLNGGYEDDLDNGYTIYYTGAGGQSGTYEEPGSQVGDQSIKHYFNHALHLNQFTGKPVRVVRGFKNPSKWAPSEGYRYDGLYKVVKDKVKTGKSGHKVCLFKLERLPNQQPLEELLTHLP